MSQHTKSSTSARPSGLSRRTFVQTVGAAGFLALLERGPLLASPLGESTPTLYYIDGYHGGAVGHMPPGCWRDIVEAMGNYPNWKLSLDVEAASWEVLQHQDPEAFERVRAYLEDRNGKGRMEIVGGTFAQPYGWAISGESNIRQLQHGLEHIHRQFPHVQVKVYAVQEPCWASCLPQLLRSFGFTGASLKNASTAWGGYTQGKDAELVNWIGPDGCSIPAVPRYACEKLLRTWETEATEVTADYARKCLRNGIPEPVGMCFQDLGWAAQPRAIEPWIRYATWSEYIERIAQAKPRDWVFSMEDILIALPWGEKTLHALARQVREAEVALVAAEKHATLAYLKQGAPWPAARLQQAWELTMWSQAHDAWITATTRSGRQAWAFQVAADTLSASETAQAITDAASMSLCAGNETQAATEPGVQFLRVINTLGHDREDLVSITIAANHGTHGFAVRDLEGKNISCQYSVRRVYRPLDTSEGIKDPVFEDSKALREADTSINTATLLFRGNVPAFGWNTYRVEALKETPKTSDGIRTSIEADGSVNLESDLYCLRFDARQGGAIARLYRKDLQQEFCQQGQLFNAFRGYFIEQKQWCSSTENPARIELLEAGPIRAQLRVDGSIGGVAFRSTIEVVQGRPRIDFQTSFHFEKDTWIGDPWDISPQQRSLERRRSPYNGRYKLQALFPHTFKEPVLDKSGAFDVCRSRNASTHFERWDEIKHNIITNWVDLYDARQNLGLALIADRTTAYSLEENDPLGLILGWGWEGGYWWGRCPLHGEQESSYSLLPHRGHWRDAMLWRENLAFEEPLVAQWMESELSPAESRRSCLRLSSPHTVLSAVTVQDRNLEIRLFHANTEAGTCRIEFDFVLASAQLIELDGRVISSLHLRELTPGTAQIELNLPQFAVRTIRITPSGKGYQGYKP